MINPKELRLGNWVINNTLKYLEEGYFVRVNIIDELNDKIAAYRNVAPIPLTPEILEKCGFETDADEESFVYYSLGDFKIDPVPEGYELMSANGAIGKPFQNLHQLQNLYFALNGEELEIKL